MAQRFQGKVVIVTGSSSGIGREVALQLGKEGASLVLHGVESTEQLQQAANLIMKEGGVPAGNILQVVGDMEDEQVPEKIISETVAKFGRIDVLINCAGTIMKPGVADPFSVENLDYLYRVNLRAVVQMTNLATPHLERTKGNIINISSISAIRSYACLRFYGPLKATIDHITRHDALNLGPRGIRVNAVSPGLTRTEVISRHPGLQQSKFEKYANDHCPLGRIAEPPELANVLRFLASDEASYVNGVNWVVDGGVTHYTNPLVLV